MSKKIYNIIAASVTGVIGVAAAVIAAVNPPMEAAWEASLPVLEGAILTILNNFVIKEDIKKEVKKDE